MYKPTYVAAGGNTPSSPRTRGTNLFPLTRSGTAGSLAESSSTVSGNGMGLVSDQAGGSAPASPNYNRSQIMSLHAILYGGRDRAEIAELVFGLYDASATFENPVAFIRGKQAISDSFSLLNIIPGQMFSELHDCAESQGYNGNRLVVLSHTLHIALLPFLDSSSHPQSSTLHPAHPYYTSFPPTPFSHSPRSAYLLTPRKTESPHLSAHLINLLRPTAILSNLTTLNLKLTTKLIFNEMGQVIMHEDTWGVKELLNAIPMVSTIYAFNRGGLGLLASTLSRVIFKPTAPREEAMAEDGTIYSGGAGDSNQYIRPLRRASIVGAIRQITEGLKLGGMDIVHKEEYNAKDYFDRRPEVELALPTMDVDSN